LRYSRITENMADMEFVGDLLFELVGEAIVKLGLLALFKLPRIAARLFLRSTT